MSLKAPVAERQPIINHISIALGSHGELETCIEIALRLGYLSPANQRALLTACDSVGRLLNGLLESLEERLQKQHRS